MNAETAVWAIAILGILGLGWFITRPSKAWRDQQKKEKER